MKRYDQLNELIRNNETYDSLLAFAYTRHVGENIIFLRAEFDYQCDFIKLANELWESLCCSSYVSSRVKDIIYEELKKPHVDMFSPAKMEINSFLTSIVLTVFFKTEDVSNLDSLLANPKLKQRFVIAARRMGVINEYTLYETIVKWESLMFVKAFSLWENYISSGSSLQVNISGVIKNNLKIKLAKPNIDTFVEVRKAVATLVVFDVLPDFEAWLEDKNYTKKTPFQEVVELSDSNRRKSRGSLTTHKNDMKKMLSSPVLPKFPGSPKMKRTKQTRKQTMIKTAEKKTTKKITLQENENNLIRVNSPKTSSNLIHRLSLYATQINSAPTVVRLDINISSPLPK
jgi:hypothetical protein